MYNSVKSKGDTPIKTQLQSICQALADNLSYELIEVELTKEPAGKILRITIDNPNKSSGIAIDDCEAYHRQLIPKVEHIEYDYLEVSSPGIDRPLKTDKDFEKSLQKPVEVHLYKPLEKVKKKGQNQKLRVGKLISYSKESVTIEAESELIIERKDIALIRPYIDINAYNVETSNEQGSQKE